MYSFRNDYSEGAHPKVLQALADTNLRQTVGYGMDPCCQAAADTIRRLCAAPDAAVHFLVGGTQVNLVTIDAFLQSYEAVVAAQTGHVSTHETGAIEATGHKVCTVESPDGKLTPALVESVLAGHNGTEHMVLPRMVYISDTTEIGTVYTRAELAALRQCCDVHGLFLYLDGARLGSALDLGCTTSPNAHFRWHMKQRGAVLAKGRLLGLQFQALLEDGLYFDLARRANELAFRLRDGVAALGYPFPVASPSNQQFPVLPNETVAKLQEMGYEFETDHPVDANHTCIRLVTSWATPETAVEDFLRDLAGC